MLNSVRGQLVHLWESRGGVDGMLAAFTGPDIALPQKQLATFVMAAGETSASIIIIHVGSQHCFKSACGITEMRLDLLACRLKPTAAIV